MESSDATALSLVENLHRADMNPRDKAIAFRALLNQLGSEREVSRQTGASVGTVRRYLALTALAPELQERLAAGETRSTQALADLAKRFADEPGKQQDLWGRIGGFRQDVQQAIIRRVDDELETLNGILDDAIEGNLGYRIVRNCPFDCVHIPEELKAQVARMIKAFDDGEEG